MAVFPRKIDLLTRPLTGVFALASILIVSLIIIYLTLGALPALRSIAAMRFLNDDGWFPSDPANPSFEMSAMIVGSIATTIGAVAIAIPLGVLSGVFRHYFAPRAIQGTYTRVVEILAGIPSVVYGFWGLVALAPLIRRLEPPGTSLLTGVIVLAIMIVPTVAILADAAIASVPKAHLEGAAALNLTRFGTFRKVVFPSCQSSFAIAGMLGAMRAIGETMAVVMVCGNVVAMPSSVFDPVRTLTANIALELGYATAEHRSVLFVSALALMLLVILLIAAQDMLREDRSL